MKSHAYTPTSPTLKPAKPYVKSFYGKGEFKYEIYPDYWKSSWGAIPLLGYVWADSEFHAVRQAYNRGLLTQNITIEPLAVRVVFKTSEVGTTESMPRPISRSYNRK